jgi:hypothetical protein
MFVFIAGSEYERGTAKWYCFYTTRRIKKNALHGAGHLRYCLKTI